MICPQCRSEQCQRSKRRTLKDYLLGAVELRPWRCELCKLRFYAWSAALRFQFMVHCRQCGNFDLQRISGRWVENWGSGAARWLGIPAYRCSPCRRRFFSVLSHTRLRSVEAETDPSMESRVASR